ncbi:MAG: ABC transporter substrate binding protein [Burkholderiales bacterium]
MAARARLRRRQRAGGRGGAPHARRRHLRNALLAGALLPLAATAAERLLVITSNDHGTFRQAEAGLRKAHPAAESLQVELDDIAAVTRAVAKLPRDAAIVTLGRRASLLVADAAPPHPVVDCMAGGDAAARSSAVPLEVPLDAQIAWLKRLLPGARNVGLLFDPAQNERRVAEAAAAWKRAGFVPVMEPVAGPAALPAALNRLAQAVDVLFAIPDRTVYAGEHSRALLLFSFRNRIPLVGPSEGWVRLGALYALEWDFGDVGRYCGALALRQLAGGKGPAPPPPRTRVVVNARTAAQQRVDWDDDVRKAFDRVYE